MKVLEVIFVNLSENSSVVTNDTQGPRIHITGRYTPSGLAVGTHFYMQHGTKTIPMFLQADAEPLVCYFQVRSPYYQAHSATRKRLFLHPQGDRSGLRKPKRDKHQH